MRTIAPTTVNGKTGIHESVSGCLAVTYNGTNYICAESVDMESAPLDAEIAAMNPSEITTITSTPFVVPLKFFGLHVPAYPKTWAEPAVQFGTVRGLHALSGGESWAALETSKGFFNTAKVANFEAGLADAFANGRDYIYCLDYTPTWASSNPSSSDTLGLGAAWLPADLGDLTDFVTWICGKALAAGYTTGFYVEGWNEPNTPGVFKGTIAELVTHQQNVWNAVQAFNLANSTTYKVVSPAFNDVTGISSAAYNLTNFLSNGGAAYCDHIGYHIYSGNSVIGLRINNSLIDSIKTVLTNASVTKTVFMTEVGASTIAKYDETNYLTRAFLYAAANCVARFCFFKWGTGGGLGDMALEHAPSQWNRMVDLLDGKTIDWVNKRAGSAELVASIDGVVVRV